MMVMANIYNQIIVPVHVHAPYIFSMYYLDLHTAHSTHTFNCTRSFDTLLSLHYSFSVARGANRSPFRHFERKDVCAGGGARARHTNGNGWVSFMCVRHTVRVVNCIYYLHRVHVISIWRNNGVLYFSVVVVVVAAAAVAAALLATTSAVNFPLKLNGCAMLHSAGAMHIRESDMRMAV